MQTEARTFEAEELALLPRHVAEACRVRRDVEDHRDEHDRGPRRRVLRAVDERPARVPRQICGHAREPHATLPAGCGADVQ